MTGGAGLILTKFNHCIVVIMTAGMCENIICVMMMWYYIMNQVYQDQADENIRYQLTRFHLGR